MKLFAIIGSIATSVIILVIAAVVGLMYVSASNTEIRLRNQAEAVQLDNTNEFDLMWKKISQVAQVTKAERASVEKIIIEYAGKRTGTGSRGGFINAVRESLPNISDKAFTNLQNIIVSSRDRFAMRQKQLIDLKREHDNLRMTFPNSMFIGSRPELEIKIITSTRTEEAFETGKDDNVDLGL